VFSNWYFVFPSNWYLLYHWCCLRQNTNWRTQDKKNTIGINKTTPVIQKIPIRGKDKIPIGEHRTKKLQFFPSNWYLLYHWCCFVYSDCNFFVLCSPIGILSFPLIGIFCITGVVLFIPIVIFLHC
jgi:hypothetical protein